MYSSSTLIGALQWPEYALLDSGNGRRLERFGRFVLSRPDPQAIWHKRLDNTEWEAADATFHNQWMTQHDMPDKWILKYKSMSFWAKLTPFKHTGVFPEQTVNWDLIIDQCSSRPKSKVLNLFAYTGIATLAAAAHNAEVTHVDASKPAIGWARENLELSGLRDCPVRWIVDDALKFTSREIRRGIRYDGIVLDPPVYGHGPHGETWDFMRHFPPLLEQCISILSPQPLFFIVNAYAISASHLMLQNLMSGFSAFKSGTLESGELVLEEHTHKRQLSTGIFSRWHS